MTLEQMLARQQEIIDLARSEGRALSDAENAELNSLQEQINSALASRSGNGEGSGDGGGEGGDDGRRNAILQEERTRMRQVREICEGFGIDPARYIEDGSTPDAVRAAVLEQLRSQGGPISIRVGEDEEDKRRNAMVDGILLRNNIRVENPAAGAEEFRGASISMIAASCLAREDSERNYYMMSANDLYSEVMQRGYYNPTSAFPAIMDQVINKAYVEGHRTAATTFEEFTTKGTLKDFKKADNYYVQGSFGEFLEVKEGAELKHTTFEDEKLPQRQLKTYGRQFTMSRQAFINDDMGVITRLPNQAAKAAKRTINNHVYKILTGNPKIYDGKVLFGADHKNLLKTGSGVTKDAVQSMILALGGHRTNDGDAIIINPGCIVVPLGYKFAMYTLFNSQIVSASGDVNPLYQYRDVIKVVEDATLNALAGSGAIPWFMVGAQSDTDFIQVDYLNGQEIPNIRRMEKAGELGFTWDVYLDWGITVLDYRGAVKNPGETVTSPIATV